MGFPGTSGFFSKDEILEQASIMPAMLMPGIIGTSTDRAITAEPMSRLLLY
jgi:hypothetical protein